MSGREVGMRGVLRPEIEDRALDREVSRLEQSLEQASRITPDIDTRGIRRRLERAIPGGRAFGSGIDRVRGRLSSSSATAGGGGPTGTEGIRPLLTAQLDELGDIKELIRKQAFTEAKSGGSGGGGGLGLLSTLGILSSVSSIGSLLKGGKGLGIGRLIGGALSPGSPLFVGSGSSPDLGPNGEWKGMDGPIVGAIETLKNMSWPDLPDLPELNIPSAKDIPKLNLPGPKDVPKLNLPLPKEVPDLNLPLPKEVPELNLPSKKDLPKLNLQVPKWLKKLLPSESNGTDTQENQSSTSGGGGGSNQTYGVENDAIANTTSVLADIAVGVDLPEQELARQIENALEGERFNVERIVEEKIDNMMRGL